jgi:hypothetical protein
MKQSRAMSLIEALANVAVGYGVAVLTQIAVFALFGLSVTLVQNLMMGGLFTVVSIMRSYALRRVFERFRATGCCGGHDARAGPARPPE